MTILEFIKPENKDVIDFITSLQYVKKVDDNLYQSKLPNKIGYIFQNPIYALAVTDLDGSFKNIRMSKLNKPSLTNEYEEKLKNVGISSLAGIKVKGVSKVVNTYYLEFKEQVVDFLKQNKNNSSYEQEESSSNEERNVSAEIKKLKEIDREQMNEAYKQQKEKFSDDYINSFLTNITARISPNKVVNAPPKCRIFRMD